MRLTAIFFALLFFLPAHALAQNIERIVSLKPNITLILQSLGLSEKVVGFTKYCPKINNTAAVVGDYNSVDVETIVRLKPDLILTSQENSQSRQFEALKSANLNIQLLAFQNYDQMIQSVQQIATLVGYFPQGLELVKHLNEKLAKLSEQRNITNKIPKSFVVIVQRRPLMVAAGNTYISSILTKAGLKNAYQQNQIAYPVMDEEDLVHENFDCLFDLSFENTTPKFLNKTVIPLKTEDFLAAPQSIDNLEKLFMSLRGP